MKQDAKLAAYQAKQEILVKRSKRGPRDNRMVLIAAVAAFGIAFAGQYVYFNFGPGFVAVEAEAPADAETDEENPGDTEESTNSELVPSPDIAEDRTWSGSLNLGAEAITFELDGALAPQAVANFVALSQQGFYEGVSCHRLVTEGIYVLQCGDPEGTGSGGPGYNWGPIENAPAGDLYEAGTIAMARRGGDAASMGSQFFIVYENSVIPSDAAGGYTVFGKLTSGLDAVLAIAQAGTADGGSDGAPLTPVSISGLSLE